SDSDTSSPTTGPTTGSTTSPTTGSTTDDTTTAVTATIGTTTGTTGTTDPGTTDPGTTDSSSTTGLPPDNCEVKCGETGWSYVWVANSTENTISKIDTREMTEVGRYRTRPDHLGSPSRTSVSIDAKAVVVANRSGGITKIWSREEYCTDKNGNGVIDTSTGKLDVLPFDQDECIAWYTEFPGAT